MMVVGGASRSFSILQVNQVQSCTPRLHLLCTVGMVAAPQIFSLILSRHPIAAARKYLLPKFSSVVATIRATEYVLLKLPAAVVVVVVAASRKDGMAHQELYAPVAETWTPVG